MSIMWQYLDKKTASVSAMKDFGSMQYIIEHTDDDIRRMHDSLTSIGAVNYDGQPKAHNPQAAEERLVSAIDEIDVLKERYRQAQEYMDWFLPVWQKLTEDDRYVLQTFYAEDELRSDAICDICEHFGIERSSAYNKKNRALNKLSVLLYGK